MYNRYIALYSLNKIMRMDFTNALAVVIFCYYVAMQAKRTLTVVCCGRKPVADLGGWLGGCSPPFLKSLEVQRNECSY